MEYTTYIVDGQALVNHIHSIKHWVYFGLIRIHVPLHSIEAVEYLYKKSLELKETPKEERQQKRLSGRPRRDQPLFDINPRIAKEYLERAGTEGGLHGVTLQGDGEDFTQWKEEDEKAAKAEEKTTAPPTTWTEALLKKVNLAEPDDNEERNSSKPKLVTKSNNTQPLPFRYHKTPQLSRQSIPPGLHSFVSNALWRTHEFENDPLNPDIYAVLVQDIATAKAIQSTGLPITTVATLKDKISSIVAKRDHRDIAGQVEDEFPNAPQGPPQVVRNANVSQSATSPTNGHGVVEQGFKELEAVALSVVQSLEHPELLCQASDQEQLKAPSAELRPSISYAMAAGATSRSPNPTSPITYDDRKPASIALEPIEQEVTSPIVEDIVSTKTTTTHDDEPDSDEDVVVFDPRARQAAQAGRKRRSQDVTRPVSRHISRPTTSNSNTGQPSSPRVTKSVLESTLKPQSPVFTPRQTSGTPAFSLEAQLSFEQPQNNLMELNDHRESPPKRAPTASPQAQTRPNPRQSRSAAQTRPVSSDDAHRQSELILQRQREAVKRTAQAQEMTNVPNETPPTPKSLPREIDMQPTSNPVVIDPDEFSRDYTIRTGAPEEVNGRPKNEFRERGGKRGGRGRGKQHHQKQQEPKTDTDYVLKSGSPRATTRGRGKLWVP